MKILYLYKDYFPVLGGIENHTRQLAEAMTARGHSVEVLVTNTARSTVTQSLAGVSVLKTARWINVTSAPVSPRMAWEYLRRRFSSRQRPDIVHLQAPYPPGELIWLLGSFLPRLGRPRIRTVMSYQSDIVRQKKLLTFYAPFLRLVLRRVDLILASSPNYIQSSSFLKPVEDRCRVVSLGIDHTRFSDPATRPSPAVLDDLTGPVLLFTGRLRYYKGLHYLVEAMPSIATPATLVIVGIGPMAPSLREQVARLGLEQRVRFVGEISDEELPGFYAAADVFVLPACERSEAYGLVQLEAMAAGKPVVTTELGTGTSYINQHEISGLVVPPADPPALAAAINRLLADDELRLEMGRRARERVRTLFSLERMANAIEQVYMELLSSGG